MRKEGYRPAKIQHSVRALRAVARKFNLLNPEAVKDQLSKGIMSETRKVKICEDLNRFYKYKGIQFDKPRYRKIETLPFISLEVEVNQLISGVGRKTACYLQLLKETGMRTGEAYDRKWTDLDLENGSVTVLPEKHARQLKVAPPSDRDAKTASEKMALSLLQSKHTERKFTERFQATLY